MAAEFLLVLQARMGSARLPGKVLALLDGQPLLVHCVRRLAAAGAGPVVVATTTAAADDPVCEAAARAGAWVHRGPEVDVLERFRQVLARWPVPCIVRATADNPAVDPDSVHRVGAALAAGADYAVEQGLPTGATVEAVRRDVLMQAAAESTEPYDREHVTPFVRRRVERFVVRVLDAPASLNRPDLRFTVDTPADLASMRQLLHRVGGATRIVGLAELIAAADTGRHVGTDVA